MVQEEKGQIFFLKKVCFIKYCQFSMRNKQKEEETIEKLNVFPPENLVEVLRNPVYKISNLNIMKKQSP